MQTAGLYATYDTTAEMIVGGIMLHRIEPTAIREFADLAADNRTIVHSHLEEFQLIRLGYLELEDGKPPVIVNDFAVVMAGTTLRAAQQTRTEATNG